MPAIAGTSLSSWCWSPCRIAPPATRNSSGSTKLKKAALGLRQNMRRSRRYWRQVRVRAWGGRPASAGASPARAPRASATGRSGIGGQLQVHVLERGTPDAQLAQLLATAQRLTGQLVQQSRGVFGLVLDEPAVAVQVGDAVLRPAHAELARGPDREHTAVLDDRHAVGELLRLVQVVGCEKDRLAE